MEMTPLTQSVDQWTKFYNENIKHSENDHTLALILDTIADAIGSQNFQMSDELTICFTQEQISIIKNYK